MLIEGAVEFVKPLRRDALAQHSFAPGVSDQVQHDTAERRTGRSHQNIQKEARAVLIHVTGDHNIHGQADGGGVQAGDDEYAPSAERRQQYPQESGVAVENVLDRVQQASVAASVGGDLLLEKLRS